MAYMSQEKKKELAPKIRTVLKKYGMKGTIGVKHHSTLVVNIKEGPLDLLKDVDRTYLQVNPFHIVRWSKDDTIKSFYSELIDAMKGPQTGWFDESDIMTDYFNTAWYIDINVGKWDKPYIYTPAD